MANGIRLDQDYPPIDVSNALWERSLGLIPAGTQTLAKGPGQYVNGVAPNTCHAGRARTSGT